MPSEAAAAVRSPRGEESMAARLARQRQQRSKLRTSNVPLEEAAEGAAMTPGTVGSELQILRAEVAESGATITKLQTQLKQSDREMQEMGERTARIYKTLSPCG